MTRTEAEEEVWQTHVVTFSSVLFHCVVQANRSVFWTYETYVFEGILLYPYKGSSFFVCAGRAIYRYLNAM